MAKRFLLEEASSPERVFAPQIFNRDNVFPRHDHVSMT
jgi:hypothetical protein